MPLNISYYRCKGQVKAFPKFNSQIYSYGKTKPKALNELRKNPQYIMWLHDQYTTGEITKDYLAEMMGVVGNIDNYIKANKLIIRSTKQPEKFYFNTTQIAILRRLQRGGCVKQNDGKFYLVDVLDKVIPIAKERYPSVTQLLDMHYIKQGKNKVEHVYDGMKYNKITYSTYVLDTKGVTALLDVEAHLRIIADLCLTQGE